MIGDLLTKLLNSLEIEDEPAAPSQAAAPPPVAPPVAPASPATGQSAAPSSAPQPSTPEEAASMRQEVMDAARAQLAMPQPQVPEPPSTTWEGLIPRSSRAYKRGSIRDGIAFEVERMRELSRGSPFDADSDTRPRPATRRRVP